MIWPILVQITQILTAYVEKNSSLYFNVFFFFSAKDLFLYVKFEIIWMIMKWNQFLWDSLSILVKELTAATRIMQSSSNELSTLVSDKAKM